MSDSPNAKVATYAGLFLITLATLMHEILLTRIFSVTIRYHFAFMAVSVGMFGMTVGAILVYLLPRLFDETRTKQQLAVCASLFSASIVVSFLTHLAVPFITRPVTLVSLYSIGFTYVVIAVPLVFSGICVCLALTRFPGRISQLYAADLAGAAIGCFALVYTLKITDGPTAVIVVAAIAAASALCFAIDASSKPLVAWASVLTVALGAFSVGHTFLSQQQHAVLKLMWVKGAIEQPLLYEKWNSFSRVQVADLPELRTKPFGWGLSSKYRSNGYVPPQLGVDIDAGAGTVLTGFHGDMRALEHLKWDVTNVAHYVRKNADVMVIGVGGGRDVLSALAFDQKSVLGVEYNDNILNTTIGKFGDYTGRLDENPKVRFVNDEARSFVARDKSLHDIIQVSLIDTFAATAAGAYVLAENSLYTAEAWSLFLQRLTPTGVLSFSRWYFPDQPGEMYRVAALARSALESVGVTSARGHIAVVRNMKTIGTLEEEVPMFMGVGTLLVSRAPFTPADLAALRDVSRKMDFEVVLAPDDATSESTYVQIVEGADPARFQAEFPLNIAPPTDDNPFFFNMLRLRSILDSSLWDQGYMRINMVAVVTLGALVCVVALLTFLCVLVPLMLTTRKESLRGASPLFLYFGAIGFGFMLVEISQMQRLIVFLGHPVYGLSVVLFALLLSSGAGSFFTQRVAAGRPAVFLVALLIALVAFGFLTPVAIRLFGADTTPVRIAVAIGTLLPVGFFMGMALPLGMKLVSNRSRALAPWLWGINGATSVCASVVSVAIALSFGISAAFWAGLLCYAVAVLSYLWVDARKPAPADSESGAGALSPAKEDAQSVAG